ncbi:MAG: hypothetical protein A3C43_08015 [Candidatus Schekmanbacteria bacterium RIFCSPHIGHO2_02_FULL_38_11]|uniref:CN hydrolase domain-containing protein n=1 Tax=Candidatus Schekmanbacteria bacterium RIFCSPLOWO2_12_FULL_38_15 TaxID=1817883 RepID=A0A1F7SL62_9BACT|nr:MAG: hypothetical protein A3H37_08285 [Candidatus Schekmanbacteria bacterium RIFCSPLOWO2_02_FULL_38_14]OGL48327.1 MAG: hypothetical protein A3C43_08015 [Candidatus Schekmanbacteria bacterium RIFCSPHIGHO2_02_FULL_38_11]OGL54503.1 MAG: hypothetical protein A3G31_10105 [Candidatus Schekmanbacteria bacterium RIFCSPLOWO2_12_FULL_38_15]
MNTKNKSKITIGLIQTLVSENPEANLKNIIEKVKEAAGEGAKIVCLQELFSTKYFPQFRNKNAFKLAETIPGKTTDVLSALAKDFRIVIIAPIFEKDSKKNYFNSAVVINTDGKLLNTYRKVHIPQDSLFYEKTYFKPGNSGFKVYNTEYAKIGVLICYDQWFPEAARILALKGADIIFYPTAIGWIRGYTSPDGDWHDAWEIIQRSHAIASGVHVASVNRVGTEGKLEFWGQSFVCDSFGKVLKRASSKKEEVVVVEVDLSKNKRIRDGWGFLKNRRPETYGMLVKK